METVPEKCCFYWSLRTGAVIISIVGAFTSTVQLVVYSLALEDGGKTAFSKAFYEDLDDVSVSARKAIFIAYVIKVVLDVLAYCALIVGTVMKWPKFVLCYLAVITFTSVTMLFRTIALFIMGWNTQGINMLALAFSNWVVVGYCILAMIRFYLGLKETTKVSNGCV